MKLRSGIAPAQQDRLILKVDPIDSLSIGKRMSPARIPRGTQDSKNHWSMLFKAAILSTVLSVGSEAGMSGNSNGSLAEAIQQGMSQSVNQTGQQVVSRSLSIQPTITIRPGFPVRVMVTKDLVLEPYQG